MTGGRTVKARKRNFYPSERKLKLVSEDLWGPSVSRAGPVNWPLFFSRLYEESQTVDLAVIYHVPILALSYA